MSEGLHSHKYGCITTWNDGHFHRYSGTTSYNPYSLWHDHSMKGTTTFNDGHVHHYTLYTSPGIPVPGGHTHFYQAFTSCDDEHVHYILGFTGVHAAKN